jgi:hypothetical protein
MNYEDCPHEIVHIETNRTIGEYENYAQAYAAYEKLGTGNDGMTDHAIAVIMVYDKETRTYIPKNQEKSNA